jgi:hypothetical protein
MSIRKSKGRQRSPERVILSYAETQIWSGRYKLWKKYEVTKPRLPSSSDDPCDYMNSWITRHNSTGFNSIVGSHNQKAVDGLKKIAEDLAQNGSFPGGNFFIEEKYIRKDCVLNTSFPP